MKRRNASYGKRIYNSCFKNTRNEYQNQWETKYKWLYFNRTIIGVLNFVICVKSIRNDREELQKNGERFSFNNTGCSWWLEKRSKSFMHCTSISLKMLDCRGYEFLYKHYLFNRVKVRKMQSEKLFGDRSVYLLAKEEIPHSTTYN